MSIALAGTLAPASAVDARTTLTVSSGVEYSSGDYGEAIDTEVVSVPLSVRVRRGEWALRVSAPYLRVTGPADVADFSEGGGGSGSSTSGDTGNTFTRQGTQSGLGDTTVSLSRTFRPFSDRDIYFDAIGRVRIPTGDEDRGLGVGATDYMLGGEAGVGRRGGGAHFSLQRRFLGEPSPGIERDAGWLVNTGGWLRLGEQWTLGGNATWREATKQGRDDPAEIGGYIGYDLSEGLRVTVSAGAGLNDASPDMTAGVRFSWRRTFED